MPNHGSASVPLRSIEIFSGEFVLGPISMSVFYLPELVSLFHTNCANDGRSTVDLLGLVLGVEVGLPFQLGTIIEVSQRVRHVDDGLLELFRVYVRLSGCNRRGLVQARFKKLRTTFCRSACEACRGARAS